MRLFLLLLILLSASLHADPEARRALIESEQHCSNFVRYDDQYVFLGFGPYRSGFDIPRKPTWGRLVVRGTERRFELTAQDAVVDTFRQGDILWVLTYSGLEKWDLNSETKLQAFNSHPSPERAGLHEHATGLVPWGDSLFISHGRKGVLRFNLKSERFDQWLELNGPQAPLESMATGIARSQDKLFVVMDNFSLVNPGERTAFRGIVTIDPTRFRVTKRQDILDPGATSITINGDTLLVGFYGIFWKYSIDTLARQAAPEPDSRFWNFPLEGVTLGKPVLDETYFYSCFSEGSGPQTVRRPRAFEWKKLPGN